MSELNSNISFNPFIPQPNNFKNLTGEQFGYLTVYSIYGRNKWGSIVWLCRCVCGQFVVQSAQLLKGNRSCGCQTKQHSLTHGECQNGKPTPEYRIYKGAKNRCNNTNSPKYKIYGGRGIQFKFTSFEEFLEEIGRRPSPQHSLDRKNTNGHYEKGNIQWATPKEQARNTRQNRLITINGETKCLIEWCEFYKVPRTIVEDRLRYGWETLDALTRPVRRW